MIMRKLFAEWLRFARLLHEELELIDAYEQARKG